MGMVGCMSAFNWEMNFHRQNNCWMKIILCFGMIFFLMAATPTSGLAAKRVGIVYSEGAANQFYDKFTYSQLFMVMQHQAMMAGIPFDVLVEEDLLNTARLMEYDALIIPILAQAVDPSATAAALRTASQNGMGIITAGTLISAEATAQILGIEPLNEEYGGTATVIAGNVSHPVMREYASEEIIGQYDEVWFDSYRPKDEQSTVVLVRIQANNQNHNGVLAVIRGGRHVHFANDRILGNWNLVWSALQWVVFGEKTPVALKLGRHKSIFVGRNDMDSSMFAYSLNQTDIPLLDLVSAWKEAYNFVGSYYINIGNDPANGQYTDWQISSPLYRAYIEQGNEIGTHSYTHPAYTDQLNNSELEFEFNQSQLEIESQLGIEVTGAAIPGNPEPLEVDWELNNYVDYTSGRSSVYGPGYPGAIGYLSPEYDMLYFSLNLSPDFVLIHLLGHTPDDASGIWSEEYATALKHASQPIIHWLWHDYGPTIQAGDLYSKEMYEDTIAMAFYGGSEFATADDIQKRIRSFQSAVLEVEESGTLIVDVEASAVGQFSLALTSDQVISRVDNWYAYDEDQVFIPQDGGRFIIRQGTDQSEVTRIVAMPMRAKLIRLNGDGTTLEFTFEGEGTVAVRLNPAVMADLKVQGADSTTLDNATLEMHFDRFGEHTASISLASTTNRAPLAKAQFITTDQGAALSISLSATDPEDDHLIFRVTSGPNHGVLSGTPPNLTYTPQEGFKGSDSFEFVASDGQLGSSPASVVITVKGINQPPVTTSQSLSTEKDVPLPIPLSASDPEDDPLTFQIVSDPNHGALSGTLPNVTYTPDAGFVGEDSFSFVVNDGLLASSPAGIAITVTSTDSEEVEHSNYSKDITIDGDPAEWNGVESFGPDPDEIPDTANYVDWREGWMSHDDTHFYLAFRNDTAIDLSWGYNIYLDTDDNAATGFHNGGLFFIGADYVLQDGYLYQYTGDGSDWSWNFLGAMPQGITGKTAEFAIPRTDIGNPDHIRLLFYGDNTVYGNGALLDLYPDQALNADSNQRFFTYTITANVHALKINEVLAGNAYTNYDPDFKQFSDWIELHNESSSPLNIGGYYLSDDSDNPTKWKIPSGTSISANGYLLIWADGEDVEKDGLHANFKLDQDGESVVLSDSSGIIIDQIDFPEQEGDVSCTSIDGSIYYMAPTPKTVNSAQYPTLDLTKKPDFSIKSGFYNETQTVTLTPENGGTIYYTTDGSHPTEDSTVYTGPITVNKTTVIRAIAKEDGKFSSKIKNRTYLINENISLPVVSISIDDDFLWDSSIGIYENYDQDWMRAAGIEYIKDGISQFNENIGVRIAGGYTRNYDQKSLAIFAKDCYGPKSIKYALFPNKPQIKKVKSFVLRNGGNDWGYTMMREGLVHMIVKDNMDIDFQSYHPSIVFINGEYWGIHNVREKINENYLEANHGVDSDNVDLLEGKYYEHAGTNDNYLYLIEYIKNNSLSNENNYAYVAEKIDIVEYINYMITELYVGNRDWPHTNIKYWKEKVDGAKWRWVLYDTDLSMDILDYNSFDHALEENGPAEPNPPWSTFLFRSLMNSELFKQEFISRFCSHLNTTFQTDRIDPIITRLKNAIAPEIERHFEKWHRRNTEDWETGSWGSIAELYSFSKNRNDIVRSLLQSEFNQNGRNTLTIPVAVNGRIRVDGIPLENDYEGKYFDNAKVTLNVEADEGHRFVRWSNGAIEESIQIILNNDVSIAAEFAEADPDI